MAQSNDQLRRKSIRVYARLLRLYPRPFREEFGPQMLATFRAMLGDPARGAWGAWRAVAGELAPTLLREWADHAPSVIAAWFRTGGPARAARAACAVIPPILAILWLMSHLASWPERAVLGFLAACAAIPLVRGGGRGWSSVVRAVAFALAAGVATLATIIFCEHGPFPPAAALLTVLGVVGGAAFVMANYVRLVVEGLSIGRHARCA